MKNTERNIKIYGLVIGIALFILLLAGLSYAYYQGKAEDTTTISGDIGMCFEVNYTKGGNVSGADLLLLDKNQIINNGQITIRNGMALTSISAGMDNTKCPNTYGYMDVYMKNTSLNNAFISGDSAGALKYVIASYDKNTYPTATISALSGHSFDIVKEGTVSDANDRLLFTDPMLPMGSLANYLVIFYLDGDLTFNDGGYTNFSTTISATAYPFMGRPVISILKQFTPNSTVVNNNITYDIDTSRNLIKDKRGNIRYYGASPNNYIDLGEVNSKPWERFSMFRGMFENSEQCYATADCNTNYAQIGQLIGMTFTNAAQCNAAMPSILANAGVSSIDEICGEQPILWRIIGIVDGKVKLIRNESIGNYSWDTSASTVNSGLGINEWSQSDLMKLLNPGYENTSVNNSLYYNSGSGYCYNGSDNSTDDCDFTSIGIKDSAIKNLIANATYYTGGWNSSSVYPNFMLEKERGTTVVVPGVTCTGDWCNDNITRTTIWTGRIALPYPSDYGYAADLSQCNQNLQSYDDSTCITNNWMTGIGGMWLLTPNSGLANSAWYAYSGGYVYYDNDAYYAGGVVPVLYLTSDALIESGSGTEGDPYTLAA